MAETRKLLFAKLGVNVAGWAKLEEHRDDVEEIASKAHQFIKEMGKGVNTGKEDCFRQGDGSGIAQNGGCAETKGILRVLPDEAWRKVSKTNKFGYSSGLNTFLFGIPNFWTGSPRYEGGRRIKASRESYGSTIGDSK